jgi:GT2 family glycosyltransferase
MSTPLTILIVNWNSGSLLVACLDSLRTQTWTSFRVVVVDNASEDGSADGLDDGTLDLTVLRAPRNLGFAAGNNYGLAHGAPGEWVLLLNPDTRAAPGCLAELMRVADANPQFDAFGARLMRMPAPDDRCAVAAMGAPAAVDEVDGLGDVYHASGRYWRHGHRGSWRRLASSFRADAVEVFSACGAAALYRTARLQELGGFDDDYFCYSEDVDLGFRLRLAGARAACVPSAVVFHLGSAVTGERSAFSVYHGHRNLVWTFVKDMPGVLFWLLLPLHLALNVGSVASLAARGQGAIALRAKRDALRGLGAVWRKRGQVQGGRVASVWQIARQLQWGLPLPSGGSRETG